MPLDPAAFPESSFAYTNSPNCDDATIAEITGHETLAMVRKYRAKHRRARLAIARLNRRWPREAT